MIMWKRVLAVGALLLLSGCNSCNRYVRWVKQQFIQVDERCSQDCCPGKAYVRHQDVYDGFNTIGHYDVLWYAAPVRAEHMKRLAVRYAWNEGTERERLKREHTTDQDSIVFYLLASADNTEGTRPHITTKLDDAHIGMWSVVLRKGEFEYPAAQLKKVLLPTELMYCFGERFDYHYRFIYQLTFARKHGDIDLIDEPGGMTLLLRGVKYEVAFTWDACLIAQSRACRLYQASADDVAAQTCSVPLVPLHGSEAQSPMGVQEVRI